MTELSIIILAGDQADRLHACLESLAGQTQSIEDFEVIVVFEGSSDGTNEMLANFKMPYRLRVLCVSTGGSGAARNHGVQAAEGQYCLFLSAGVLAHSNLVAEHLKSQCKGQGMIGLGQLLFAIPRGADGLARYVAQERQDRYEQLGKGVLPVSTDCYGDNLSFPRASILKLGGFATDLSGSESIELAYRLEREGLLTFYIPDAIVTLECYGGFQETAAQVQMEGAASIELYQRHLPLLPHMRLARFHNMSSRAIILRRCLLAINGSIRLLAVIGTCLIKNSWRISWYSFLYHYCYWRGVQGVVSADTWNRLVSGTTILMYHACGYPGESASLYVIPGRRFARQMAWLKWRGYHVLSLEDFLGYHRAHRLPPPRSVVITFDDGYADNWAVACPILFRHGFSATIFVVSERIGTVNGWDSAGLLVGRPLLTWSDLKEMVHGGLSIGSHTKNHVSLAAASISRIEEEVEGSRAQLERGLGLPVLAFSYPNGKHDTRSQAIVECAGFLGACSSHSGVNDPSTPPYILRRIEIRGTYSLIRFAAALWFGQTHILPRRKTALHHSIPDAGRRA